MARPKIRKKPGTVLHIEDTLLKALASNSTRGGCEPSGAYPFLQPGYE
jgi:hypothetical protein